MPFLFALGAAIGAWALGRALALWARFQVRRGRDRDRPGEPTRLWFFWWALTALSVVGVGLVAGHPLLGLVLTAVFPAMRWLVVAIPRQREQRALEASALLFFHGLQGLLRAGFSLPTALFRLSESLDSPFATLLRGALAGFEKGKTLSSCLDRFQHRSRLSQAGLCLDLLEQAHGRGIGLAPFLDRVLPWLEAEGRERDKLDKARAAAFAQAGLSAVLPWAVAVLAVGSPLAWSSAIWAVAGFGLFLQIGGFWVVAKTARFE